MDKKKIKYEIVEQHGILSTSPAGWTKEINRVSWNDRPAKWDIRDWGPDREKIGKGATLTDEEATILLEALQRELLQGTRVEPQEKLRIKKKSVHIPGAQAT